MDVHHTGLDPQDQVADDGRLNLPISDTDVELARQVQQVHIASNKLEPPSALAYQPSEPDSKHVQNPPPLNIVIHVIGSRGDVQPFVAFGQELRKSYGHRVRLATHAIFKKFVEGNDLEFFNIGGDPALLLASMTKDPAIDHSKVGSKEDHMVKRLETVIEMINGCWKSCVDVDGMKGDSDNDPKAKPFVANIIIAVPASYAHVHCAQKLGIPLHMMSTIPWSPTRAFAHPVANLGSPDAEAGIANEMSWSAVDSAIWQGLGGATNKLRKEHLGLEMLDEATASTMIPRLQIPHTYCWSPSLVPKPNDWGRHIDISGYYFLDLGSKYQPDDELKKFLASGPAPVYVGFGSIVLEDPKSMIKLIFDAVRKSGQRALVSKGWAGFAADELEKPEDVFMLGDCPHDWLFRHVSCVVHHGGAGTTAAGIALGRPTVVVPFFGDQHFWGGMIERAGAGPSPIPWKELTADNLAEAISLALKPGTLERATELGERIRDEKGCEAGAASFHAHLDVDRLRCMMTPNRVAVWQVDNHGPESSTVKLSAFAAAVLGNEGLLDINELKLYRPYEYAIQEHNNEAPDSGRPNPEFLTLGALVPGLISSPIHDDARSLFNTLRKNLDSDTLSLTFAAHLALGSEEARTSTEKEYRGVLERWHQVVSHSQKGQCGSSAASAKS